MYHINLYSPSILCHYVLPSSYMYFPHDICDRNNLLPRYHIDCFLYTCIYIGYVMCACTCNHFTCDIYQYYLYVINLSTASFKVPMPLLFLVAPGMEVHSCASLKVPKISHFLFHMPIVNVHKLLHPKVAQLLFNSFF